MHFPIIRSGNKAPASEVCQSQRYEQLDFASEAKKCGIKSTKMKVAAFATLIFGALLLGGAVAGTALLISNPATATLSAAFVFIFGMQLYTSYIKNNLFLHFHSLHSVAKRLEQLNLDCDQATRGCPDRIVALKEFWQGRAKSIEEKCVEITKQINQIKVEMVPSMMEVEFIALEDRLTLLKQQKHNLREGEYFPALVHAAYFHHLSENKGETRSEDQIITFSPLSFRKMDHFVSHSQVETQGDTRLLPPFLQIKPKNATSPSVTVYRDEIEGDEIESLSKLLFLR